MILCNGIDAELVPGRLKGLIAHRIQQHTELLHVGSLSWYWKSNSLHAQAGGKISWVAYTKNKEDFHVKGSAKPDLSSQPSYAFLGTTSASMPSQWGENGRPVIIQSSQPLLHCCDTRACWWHALWRCPENQGHKNQALSPHPPLLKEKLCCLGMLQLLKTKLLCFKQLSDLCTPPQTNINRHLILPFTFGCQNFMK